MNANRSRTTSWPGAVVSHGALAQPRSQGSAPRHGSPSMLKLHCVEGPDKGAYFPVSNQFTLLLGRSRHSDTRLKDMSVSRVHAEVEVKGRRVLITDLESASGTYINGKRVGEGEMQLG